MGLRFRPRTRIARFDSVNISIFEACVIGLVAAAGAVLLKEGVGLVGTWRVHQAASFGSWILPVIGGAGGLICGILVRYVAPETAGSGIAQTKAALSGLDFPLGLRTALVKMAGCIASLGSGLALGREGPTVQVAAGIASKFSGLIPTTPAHRNQLIAAGAGAGLAAAFNAPLAGALFVLEVLLKRMSGRAVGTTVVACFVAAVVSRLVGVQSLDIDFTDMTPRATFAYYDIPFYVMLGVLAGFLGACFNKVQILGMGMLRRIKFPRVLACMIAGVVTGLVLMQFPYFFRDYAGSREALVRGEAGLVITLVTFALQFFLTTTAFTTGAPGGIFAPTLTMGACLGHLVSVSQQYFIGTTHPQSFAIVGMGAVFCAVARSPMTAVVIIFEMTTDFNVVLPLMICCVIGYFVAESLNPDSIYDQILRFQGVVIKEEEESTGVLHRLTAMEVLSGDVSSIPQSLSLAEARKLFSASDNGYFPVLDENDELVGVLTLTDMETAEKRRISDLAPVKRVMTSRPLAVRPDEKLSNILVTMDRLRLKFMPVVERHKLIGVITQEAILAAESKALGKKRRAATASYTVYQTRSPESGRGSLLVAVADPSSARSLLRLAARIAKARNFDLECLNVIPIPHEQDPAEAVVSPVTGRQISQLAEDIGIEFGISVHTSIRVSHDIGDAICDTIDERQSDLFLMRWVGGQRDRKGRDLMSSVLRNTSCPAIMVARLEDATNLEHICVPVAGAGFLAPSISVAIGKDLFAGLSGKRIHLYKTGGDTQEEEINETISKLESILGRVESDVDALDQTFDVEVRSITARSPSGILLELERAESSASNGMESHVTILGMQRKSFLKMMNKGSFKKVISTRISSPLVLVCDRDTAAESINQE